MKLEMIFFDMGGTLDLYPVNHEDMQISGRKMQKILSDAGAAALGQMSPEEFLKVVLDGVSRYKRWRTRELVELSPEALWRDFILKDRDIDRKIIDAVAEELTFLIDTGFVRRTARTEMREVLGKIREKNVRMGIISNVLSRGQVAHDMTRYGIAEYMDTVVLSSVFGKRKPHPDIFRHACLRAAVPPENVLFIGNSPSKDIDGAKGANIGCTVLIEYEHNSPHDTGSEPDHRIRNLHELIPIVDALLAG